MNKEELKAEMAPPIDELADNIRDAIALLVKANDRGIRVMATITITDFNEMGDGIGCGLQAITLVEESKKRGDTLPFEDEGKVKDSTHPVAYLHHKLITLAESKAHCAARETFIKETESVNAAIRLMANTKEVKEEE